MTKERRLGRGLEALLGRPAGVPLDSNSGGTASDEGSGHARDLVRLSVYEIDGNPYQPRRDFDETEIKQLSESIKEHGLLQPILVRRIADRYQLIAGERRLRAAIKAGWSDVPAQVRDVDDQQLAELAIVENLQRKDLNALEKATSFQQYLERYGCTQDELAGRLKIDRSTLSNLIRLLELPDPVQQALRTGAISAGHARALLPLGEEREQIDFCRRIQNEGLSVRATESLVQETIHQADTEPLDSVAVAGSTTAARPKRGSPHSGLEQELRMALGTKVEIKSARGGSGKIVVHFSSAEEFDRLYELFCASAAPQGQRQAG